jgi:hypothetical protein
LGGSAQMNKRMDLVLELRALVLKPFLALDLYSPVCMYNFCLFLTNTLCMYNFSFMFMVNTLYYFPLCFGPIIWLCVCVCVCVCEWFFPCVLRFALPWYPSLLETNCNVINPSTVGMKPKMQKATSFQDVHPLAQNVYAFCVTESKVGTPSHQVALKFC